MSNKLKSIEERGPARFAGMVIQPELLLVSDGTDLFLRFDGRVIAKRGHPYTPDAMTWITLEPGVVVRDHPRKNQIIVEINGSRVH